MNKSYKNELIKKIIKSQIDELNDNKILELYQGITNELFYDDIDDLLKGNYMMDPAAAASAVYFGDVKSWNADYYGFDGYNNIKSYFKNELIEELKGYLKADYLDELADNYEDEFDFELIDHLEELNEYEDEYTKEKEAIKKPLDEFIKNKMFFAFTAEQFDEGLKKLDCKSEELAAVIAGGFINKKDIEEFKEINKKYNEDLKQLLNNDNYLAGAYGYELQNHEFGYTRNNNDAIIALGITSEFYQNKYEVLASTEQLLIDIDNIMNY